LLICTRGAHKTKESFDLCIARALACLDEWDRRGASITIDVETTGKSPIHDKVKSIAISACDEDVGISFPTLGVLPLELELEFLRITRQLCGNKKVTKVFQNLGFDCTALECMGIPIKGPVYDTLVLHHVAEPELPHKLDWFAQTILMVPPWKADQRAKEKRKAAKLKDLLEYNAQDALYTGWCLDPLLAGVAEVKGQRAAQEELKWSDLARRMTKVGVPIKKETINRIEGELLEKRDRLLTELREELNWPDLNLNKPDHRIELLYERIGLPVRKYTPKKMEPSTAYSAVVDYLHEPLVAKFVACSDVGHQLSTFVRGYRKRLSPDWRLRVSWNPTGTVRSRWTSTPNLQNVPKWLRVMCEPREGRILVGADYAALEFRILACFSGCTSLLDAIKAGVDIHSMNAAKILKEAWERLDAAGKKLMRTLIKRVIYGLNYGAEANKLHTVLREDRKTDVDLRKLITLPRVQEIRSGFFRLYPEIQQYQEREVELADSRGFINVPPLDRHRYFGAIPVKPTKAFNFRIQCTASEIMNLALLKLDAALPASADIIINGHDAVVVECDEGDAESIARLVEECLFYRLEYGDFGVDLIAEAEIGRTWDNV
jgi:DNA polymerase-1